MAQNGPKTLAESDEEVEEDVPIIKKQEALSAIQVLCQYQEQQATADYDFLCVLRIQERELLCRRTEGLNQGLLTNWVVSYTNS
jgi:hypothetical protein